MYEDTNKYAWPVYPDQGIYNAPPAEETGQLVSQSNMGVSPTQRKMSAPMSSSHLQRHPTLRPLPSAPVDDANSPEMPHIQRKSTEEIRQDAILEDLVNDLGASDIMDDDDDLLDHELGGVKPLNPRTVSADSVPGYPLSASTSREQTGDSQGDFDDDSESDLEGAAGLEAMRIADEQEARGWGSTFTYDAPAPYEPQATRQSQSQMEEPAAVNDDADFKYMDLSLVGGGYDAHLSYGGDLTHHKSSNSSERGDESRPLPTPDELSRSDSYNRGPANELGGMTDYSLHPFPAFESAPPSSFSSSSDLPRLPGRDQRMSFDEGDELTMHDRMNHRYDASGSVSPLRESSSDGYYGGPARPLPTVPSLSDSAIPHLMPAGTYRHPSSASSNSDAAYNAYLRDDPDGYLPSGMLAPNGQYVPRSTSLSSHGSTPHTVPPIRSKTDSEERQARLRAAKQAAAARSGSGLDGYDTGTPQSIALDLPDLPAGRRKKFQPSRLSPADFALCYEPWSLSGLAGWARNVAGGDTGDGETDLRLRTLEEGFVALFTHMVPTMNTADAEVLSAKVVASMFDAGILLHDEEWIKFGHGEVSGVLWQLTGYGCYAPLLHHEEIPGRCYSHHCGRTLKKLNLHSQLEPAKKLEDWATFYKVTKEQIEQVTRKELERQNNLHEIVMSEDTYMDQLNVLRILYRDDLSTWQPPIIATKRLNKFIQDVFGKVEAIKEVNENFLLPQLKYRQKEQGPWVIGFSDIFREWIRKAKHAYIDYAAAFPRATFLVRQEAQKNLLFRQFLDQAQDNKLSHRLDWNSYLKAPITRLQRYTLLLGTVLKNMSQQTEERANLAMAIEEIKAVTLECDAKVDEFAKKVQLKELQEKLQQRTERGIIDLHLDHLGRQLIHEGDLQRAGNNRFTWLDTHAILFDHYFVLAKISRDGRRETWDVSKRVCRLCPD